MKTIALGFVVAFWVFVIALVFEYLTVARWESDPLEWMLEFVGRAVNTGVGAGVVAVVCNVTWKAHGVLFGGGS